MLYLNEVEVSSRVNSFVFSNINIFYARMQTGRVNNSTASTMSTASVLTKQPFSKKNLELLASIDKRLSRNAWLKKVGEIFSINDSEYTQYKTSLKTLSHKKKE